MASWSLVTLPITSGVDFINAMCCTGAHRFVATGSTGIALWSDDDAATWHVATTPAAVDWIAVGTNGAGMAVSVSQSGATRVMYSTDDGETWNGSAGLVDDWTGVCWAPSANLWVAVGLGGVMTSPDAVTWTAQTQSSADGWGGVGANATLIIAVSGINTVMTSTDGINWTTHAGPSATFSFAGQSRISYSDEVGAFVVGGYDSALSPISAVAYSTVDGTSWTQFSTETTTAGFYDLTPTDEIGGFIATFAFDPDFSPQTPTLMGISEDAGASWSADDTTFSGLWGQSAWDGSTGTFIAWDKGPTDQLLVGEFPVVVSPVVTNVDPTHGDAAGGTVVTLTGTGFTGATSVLFGGTVAPSFTVNSDTSIVCVSPPHAYGETTVTVTT